ncbi:MAG TPA: hypothetical protein PLU72_20030 [Candidatus Ozemobacteraceae bacterium]|nr:hypothetical protein [Candidatus Ozemobacteraceae bacterium]
MKENRGNLVWFKPLRKQTVSIGKLLLNLRAGREELAHRGSHLAVVAAVTDAVLRAAIRRIPYTRGPELFRRLLDQGCAKEALALAMTEQNPARKIAWFDALAGCAPSGLKAAVAAERARLRAIYPNVAPETVSGDSSRAPASATLESLVKTAATHPERLNWTRGAEAIAGGAPRRGVIQVLDRAGADVRPLKWVLGQTREPIAGGKDAVRIVEWQARLNCPLVPPEEIRAGTGDLRADRACFLLGTDVETYLGGLRDLPLKRQVEELSFLKAHGRRWADAADAVSLEARAWMTVEDLLAVEGAGPLRKGFAQLLELLLGSLAEFHLHRQAFLEVLAGNVPSNPSWHEWLERHRSRYADAEKAVPAVLKLKDLDAVTDPVLLGDLAGNDVPGHRVDLPGTELLVYLMQRLVNNGLPALFHGLGRLAAAGVLALSASSRREIEAALLELEGFLLASGPRLEAMTGEVRELFGHRDFREALEKMALLPRVDVGILHLALEHALLSRQAALAKTVAASLPGAVAGWVRGVLDVQNGASKGREFFVQAMERAKPDETWWRWRCFLALYLAGDEPDRELLEARKGDDAVRSFQAVFRLAAGYSEEAAVRDAAASPAARALALWAGVSPELLPEAPWRAMPGYFHGWEKALAMDERSGIRFFKAIGSVWDAELLHLLHATFRPRGGPADAHRLAFRAGLLWNAERLDPTALLGIPSVWRISGPWRAEAWSRLKPLVQAGDVSRDAVLELLGTDRDLCLDLLTGSPEPRPELQRLIPGLGSDPAALSRHFDALLRYVQTTGDRVVEDLLAAEHSLFHLRFRAAPPASRQEADLLSAQAESLLQWLRGQTYEDDGFGPRLLASLDDPAAYAVQATAQVRRTLEASRTDKTFFEWAISSLIYYATDPAYRQENTLAKSSGVLALSANPGRILFQADHPGKTMNVYRLHPISRHDQYEKDINDSDVYKEVLKPLCLSDWAKRL